MVDKKMGETVHYFGIDPGLTGGIVGLDDTGRLVMCYPMEQILKAGGMRSVMAECAAGVTAIEKAQAMPKQGLSSTFHYAEGYGRLQGYLEALNGRFVLVRPRDWQKLLWVGSDGSLENKARSLQIARRLWPSETWLATPKCKKPHTGIVDAALIAEWCRRTQGLPGENVFGNSRPNRIPETEIQV